MQAISWLRANDLDEVLCAVRATAPGLEFLDDEVVLHDNPGVADPLLHRGAATIGDRYVAKYAWSREAAVRLWRESQLIRVLKLHDSALPVPTVVAASGAPAVLVVERVEGHWLWYPEASELAGPRLARTTKDLASFLVNLHRPELVAAVEAAGIELPTPRPQATTDALRQRFGRFVTGSDQRRVMAWCDWVDDVLREEAPKAVLHGDFAGHNLVWDRSSGAVRLVYDFEDAARGDPAFDFRYLPAQAGTVDIFMAVKRAYEAAAPWSIPVERVMAWHVRTALGDALWRSEASVPLPLGGTPSDWVRELAERLESTGCA